MRAPLRVEVAIAMLLLGFGASAGRAADPAPQEVTVEDALDEPADPDDAKDIRADDDPDDVGQRGLEAPKAGKTEPAKPGDATSPGADRGCD